MQSGVRGVMAGLLLLVAVLLSLAPVPTAAQNKLTHVSELKVLS